MSNVKDKEGNVIYEDKKLMKMWTFDRIRKSEVCKSVERRRFKVHFIKKYRGRM